MLEIIWRQMDLNRLEFQNIIKRKKKEKVRIKNTKHSPYKPLVPQTPVLRLAKKLIGMSYACQSVLGDLQGEVEIPPEHQGNE